MKLESVWINKEGDRDEGLFKARLEHLELRSKAAKVETTTGKARKQQSTRAHCEPLRATLSPAEVASSSSRSTTWRGSYDLEPPNYSDPCRYQPEPTLDGPCHLIGKKSLAHNRGGAVK